MATILPPELELMEKMKRIQEENKHKKEAPTKVFDGINEDEFTKKSHEAIMSNLSNIGVEDIDDLEDEEELTPSIY